MLISVLATFSAIENKVDQLIDNLVRAAMLIVNCALPTLVYSLENNMCFF